MCIRDSPKALLEGLLQAYPGAHTGEGEGQQFVMTVQGQHTTITVPRSDSYLPVGTLQNFLDRYLPTVGGTVDYIHGADVVEQLAAQAGNVGFLLPPMGKEALFPTVIPVSYTHLDVYKRQAYHRGRRGGSPASPPGSRPGRRLPSGALHYKSSSRAP